jgi:hypothetical protein
MGGAPFKGAYTDEARAKAFIALNQRFYFTVLAGRELAVSTYAYRLKQL